MRTRARWLPTAAAVAAAVVTVGVVAVGLAAPPGVRRPGPSAAASASAPAASGVRGTTPAATAARARGVLRVWDRRRATAWEHGDPVALARLYVRGSATGRRDAAMLAAYRRRGLRVTGMTRQVLRLRVTTGSPTRLALVVTDRLVDARVVGRGVRAPVPDGRPVTRRVAFVRDRGRWRVTEVSRVSRVGQPAR